MSLYRVITSGAGNRRTVSISNTRNRIARIKKWRENGKREPFRLLSNPHSIGFVLSWFFFVSGGVFLNRDVISRIRAARVDLITRLSQNILEM